MSENIKVIKLMNGDDIVCGIVIGKNQLPDKSPLMRLDRPLQIKSADVEVVSDEKKVKKYIPLSKRQDKPDSALWLIRQHNILKDSQIAKLVGITKNSVTSIRNKSHWNYNNLNPKDPVALNLFTQKDLIEAIEKAERRIKREKKQKEKERLSQQLNN